VPARLQTPRGVYRLSAIGDPARSDSGAVLTLSLERADGIERITFRCVVRDPTVAGEDSIEKRLAPWIERQFEQLREAALKSIRSEGKLLQVNFDQQ
jgi:hypothetical protein